MRLFKSEDERRKVNPSFDTDPTYGHIFNFETSKKFIKDKVVLDVGCWTGQLEHLAHKIAKKMVGVDSNEQAIEFAKKNLPDVKFMVAKAEKLPFPKSYFDTVFLMSVLEHVGKGSEKEVLRQIHKVIKPNGTLILSTDNNNILAILFDPAYFLIGHRHYSIKDVSEMLSDTGFKIIKKRFVGNLSGLISSIISLFFKYTLGFEPKYPQRIQEFLLKEHAKQGFTHFFMIAKAIK